MLPFVLAGQQIAADRLTDQRVPEGIPIRGGQQHVRHHRRAQRSQRFLLGEPADHREQAMTVRLDPAAGHPEHLASGIRQPLYGAEQQIAQRLTKVAVQVGAVDELLGEQRIPLGPYVEPGHQAGIRLTPEDLPGELCRLAPGQPG